MKKFNIKFYQHRKIFFCISLGLFVIGLLCNLIFGVELDIDFRGGALVQYSYTGEVDQETVDQAVEDAIGRAVTVTITDAIGGTDSAEKSLTISLSGSEGISLDEQKAIASKLGEAYPDSTFEIMQSTSVPPTMGAKFFAKCLVAVALAAILLVIYVALRFRKIGGMSAGVMAVIALVHDVMMVYFTFVVFGFPIDDNFIAVVLTILGYSLNDTIVIYDRVRENRRILGPKVSYEELMDTSINQTLTRSINTSLTTFITITILYIVGVAAIKEFSLTLMCGVVFGAYSSVCITGPLWYRMKMLSDKRKAKAKKAEEKAETPVKTSSKKKKRK